MDTENYTESELLEMFEQCFHHKDGCKCKKCKATANMIVMLPEPIPIRRFDA